MNATVQTKNGTVIGKTENGVSKFLGIPYAQTPVGENRFQKTKPVENWAEPIFADAYKPKCPQLLIPINPDNGLEQNEDCLYLNIWAPENAQKCPVMFWTFGGSLVAGEGSDETYDGSVLAKTGDVIVVTFNYRVGVFGGFYNFTKFDALKGKYTENAGIYDALEALRWVKNNIEAFGGDPDNITLFGESAGAAITGVLYALPQAEGLFSKAIMQSFPNMNALKDPSIPSEERIIEALGLTESTADGMLEKPTADILEAFRKMCNGIVPRAGALIQNDGELVTKAVTEQLDFHSGNKPLLIGTNKDEAAIFVPTTGEWTEQNEAMKIQMTEGIFRQPTLAFANGAAQKNTVYMYRFDFAPQIAKMTHKGAFHSAEMPYVFGNLNCPMAGIIKGSEVEAKKVSDEMVGVWTKFAHTGNPGWAPINENGGAYCFDLESHLE